MDFETGHGHNLASTNNMRPSTNEDLLLPLPSTPTALPDCCPTHSSQHDLFQQDEPPTQHTLRRLASYPVHNSLGETVTFSSVFSPSCLRKSRVLLIFIRNFFCGNCQQYLLSLGQLLPPSSLPSDTAVAIIGCGAPSLLPSYLELTHCPYPVYTDSTGQLYNKLGMKRTLSLGKNSPEYIQQNLFVGGIKSIVQGLKRLPAGDVTKAGDMTLNGGEFLFVRKETSARGDQWADEWKVAWCHRMNNTRDHTEIGRLRSVLELEEYGITQAKTWCTGGGESKHKFAKRWQPKRSQTSPPPVSEKMPKRSHTLTESLSQRRQSVMRTLSLKRSNTGKSGTPEPTVREGSKENVSPAQRVSPPSSRDTSSTRQHGGERSHSRSKAAAQILNLKLNPAATKSTTNPAKFDNISESRIALFSVVSPGRASVRSSMTAQVGSPDAGNTPLLGVGRQSFVTVR